MLDFGDFSISWREVLIGIVIIAIMITFGLMIHGAINDSLMLKYQKYNTALQIDQDTDMFKYAMETDIGNAFVYGDLKCVDPVTYPEIGGEYSYVKKVKEKYTRHSRTVTKTKTMPDGSTKTYTETEYYWTWDAVDSWSQHCEKITFLDVEFDYGAIDFPYTSHIKTIDKSDTIRYVYYGSPTKCTGTIYSDLRNGTINNTKFYHNQTIEKTIDNLQTNAWLVLFWIVWSILIIIIVCVFFYIDNRWLEDNKYKYY